jgi:hypothetical protein
MGNCSLAPPLNLPPAPSQRDRGRPGSGAPRRPCHPHRGQAGLDPFSGCGARRSVAPLPVGKVGAIAVGSGRPTRFAGGEEEAVGYGTGKGTEPVDGSPDHEPMVLLYARGMIALAAPARGGVAIAEDPVAELVDPVILRVAIVDPASHAGVDANSVAAPMADIETETHRGAPIGPTRGRKVVVEASSSGSPGSPPAPMKAHPGRAGEPAVAARTELGSVS